MITKIKASDIQAGDKIAQASREDGHYFVTVTNIEPAYRYTRVYAKRDDGSTVTIAIKSDTTIVVDR